MNIVTATCQIWHFTSGSGDLDEKYIKNLTQVYLNFIFLPVKQ